MGPINAWHIQYTNTILDPLYTLSLLRILVYVQYSQHSDTKVAVPYTILIITEVIAVQNVAKYFCHKVIRVLITVLAVETTVAVTIAVVVTVVVVFVA